VAVINNVVCSRSKSWALTEVLCHEIFSQVSAHLCEKCVLHATCITQDRLPAGSRVGELPPGPQPGMKEGVESAVLTAMLF